VFQLGHNFQSWKILAIDLDGSCGLIRQQTRFQWGHDLSTMEMNDFGFLASCIAMAHMLLALPIRLAGWLLADKGGCSPDSKLKVIVILISKMK
jgi:hypothetical protein